MDVLTELPFLFVFAVGQASLFAGCAAWRAARGDSLRVESSTKLDTCRVPVQSSIDSGSNTG